MTIAKHEIAHALGLSTWNYQWVAKKGKRGIQINEPLPLAESMIPIDSGGHLRLHGALMGPSLLPGQRKLVSEVDVLAIAEMGEFHDLTLNPEEHTSHHSPLNNTKNDSFCPPSP